MSMREVDVVPRAAAPRAHRLVRAGGFLLAALATSAVFLTDNPQHLRVAVVAAAWAFVLATFAAGRRDTDGVAAAAREAELRRAYEVELDREVAARREYELELERELRREAGNAIRSELEGLREDLAAFSGLRDEVARVASLRDDVTALMSLRQELGQLGELRADMGRLRAELTEQLSSEMLVERIVMRTQASRLPGEPMRPPAGGPVRTADGGWNEGAPPRELTGGWPALRLDEPRVTQHLDQVRTGRPAAQVSVPESADGRRPSGWEDPHARSRPWPGHDVPATTAWPATPPAPAWESRGTGAGMVAPPPAAAAPDPGRHADEPAGPAPTTMSAIAPASIARPPVHQAPDAPSPLPRPPLWQSESAAGIRESERPEAGRPPVPPRSSEPQRPAGRSVRDEAAPAAPRAGTPPVRRRRVGDQASDASGIRGPVELRTSRRPPVPSVPPGEPGSPPSPGDDRGGHRRAAGDGSAGATAGNRLAEILAENGRSPSAGGRRRRRYRDEGEPDEVLVRVLGQG